MPTFISYVLAELSNPWVIFGFGAQFIFFLRFVVQWIASERARATVIPLSFWYLSIAGAAMILVYAIYRLDIVFIAGQGLALFIYVRNLAIHYAAAERDRASAGSAVVGDNQSV
ncbi:MAG: lipid-A-disaccharide synthase N-terminal domain-containing protein [Candidatus Paceibacterota bacterium]